MQAMQVVFPFMTGYFCYILPSAMGLYWIMGNLLQMVQTWILRQIKKPAQDVLIVEPADKKKQKTSADVKKKKKK